MIPQRVVIIGAARSGTKMLRGALATAAGIGAVPYDVGYVWRYGNERAPDDVLDPAHVDDRTRRFIQQFVDGYAAGETPTVIEKTVGNTLRVPFVASVFPNAKYIHLIRDGIDVAVSARQQWTAGADWRYIAGKLRHVPLRLAPRFGTGYAQSLVSRTFRRDRRIGSWGPRYPGIDTDLAIEELLVVCARQWRESVESATQAFQTLHLPMFEVRYEDLVTDRVAVVRKLTEFMEVPASGRDIDLAASQIHARRVGSGMAALPALEQETLDREIGKALAHLGYDRPGSTDPLNTDCTGRG